MENDEVPNVLKKANATNQPITLLTQKFVVICGPIAIFPGTLP